MKRTNITNVLRQIAAKSCFFLVAIVLTMMASAKANAGDPSAGYCWLQEITLEIDGKDYVFDDCDTFYIDVQRDSNDFLKSVKVKDYKICVGDACPHMYGHDSIVAKISEDSAGSNRKDYLSYDGKETTYAEMEELDSDYYQVIFYPDGADSKCGPMRVIFEKKAKIHYDLQGGQFPEGVDIPQTYTSWEWVRLISPTKSGYQFDGWEGETLSSDGEMLGRECEEDITLTARWKETEPIDISNMAVSCDRSSYEYTGNPIEPQVGVTNPKKGSVNDDADYDADDDDDYLVKGRDYVVRYENNTAITNDSMTEEELPTAIITGVGEYKGTCKATFSIKKMTPYRSFYWEGGAYVVKGKPLSSITEGKAIARASNGSEIEGTVAWKDSSYIPNQEVGYGEYCAVTFVPKDLATCETGDSTVWVNVCQGKIADCTVEFKETDKTYVYTGAEIKPEVVVKDGGTILTEGEDYTIRYAGYIHSSEDAGEYRACVTVTGKTYYGTKKLYYTIKKAAQQKTPVLTGQNETIKGKEDGTITGLTTDMEYRLASGEGSQIAYIPVTDTKMTFAPATYEFRYRETQDYEASPATTVTIGEGKVCSIQLPENPIGYTLTASQETIAVKESVTLTFTLLNGYRKADNFVLEAEGADLTENQNGTYTISNPTKDVVITVTGVVKGATVEPTANPTAAPSATPTAVPTAAPSATPEATVEPTTTPTANPTTAPSTTPEATVEPTATPTVAPTAAPSAAPEATVEPTATPTVAPSAAPEATVEPTATPTAAPSATPEATVNPTEVPTAAPSATPVAPTSDGESETGKKTVAKVGTTLTDKKNSVVYTVTKSGKTTGEVCYTRLTNKNAKKATVPNTVTIHGVRYKVVAIGKKAFNNCKKLKSVTIGKNIISIGEKAFYGCKKLKSITIKSTTLKKKQIKEYAFKKIAAKAVIYVPKSVYANYKEWIVASGISKNVKIRKNGK